MTAPIVADTMPLVEGAMVRTGCSDHSGRDGISGHRRVDLRFGFINRGVGGCIHPNRWLVPGQAIVDRIGVSDI